MGQLKNLNSSLNNFCDSLETIIYKDTENIKAAHGENGLTISINGEWGCGKTFLIDYFIQELSKKSLTIEPNPNNLYLTEKIFVKKHNYMGLPCTATETSPNKKSVKIIKYNAFKYDNFSDPLLSLLGELFSQHANLLDKEQVRNACNKLIGGIYAIGKGIISSHPGGKEVIETIENFAKTATSDEPSYLDAFIQFNKIKENFSLKLSKLADENGLVLFFIDELDRCSPTFSIQLLETIKHFFENKNIVFIFTINRQQLLPIIKKNYGDQFDAEEYLLRFFDIDLDYPKNALFTENLCASYNEAKLKKLSTQLCQAANLTAREIIVLAKRVKIVVSTQTYDLYITYLLVYLKLKDKKQYELIKKYNPLYEQNELISKLNDNKMSTSANDTQKIQEILDNTTNDQTAATIIRKTFKEFINKFFPFVKTYENSDQTGSLYNTIIELYLILIKVYSETIFQNTLFFFLNLPDVSTHDDQFIREISRTYQTRTHLLDSSNFENLINIINCLSSL